MIFVYTDKYNDPRHWCIIQTPFSWDQTEALFTAQVSTSNATLLFRLLHENCVPVSLNPHAFKNGFQNHGISQPPVCACNPRLCKLAELCSECLRASWHHGQIHPHTLRFQSNNLVQVGRLQTAIPNYWAGFLLLTLLSLWRLLHQSGDALQHYWDQRRRMCACFSPVCSYGHYTANYLPGRCTTAFLVVHVNARMQREDLPFISHSCFAPAPL